MAVTWQLHGSYMAVTWQRPERPTRGCSRSNFLLASPQVGAERSSSLCAVTCYMNMCVLQGGCKKRRLSTADA